MARADHAAGRGAQLNRSPVVRAKRVYAQPSPDDGLRVLVDRLWPRGLSKQAAHVDLWLKDLAPSQELRQWWHHDPARMDEFARRYRDELDGNPDVAELVGLIRQQPMTTLLYAARDPAVNHVQVLLEYVSS